MQTATQGTFGSAFTSQKIKFHPTLIENLDRMGFTTPTPIQLQSIPLISDGKDIFGKAATGTGKTGAFLIPVLDSLARMPDARALIIAPTRELALQIQSVAVELSKNGPVRSLSLVGGESMFNQIRRLGGRPQLLIATPGRLLDHLQEGTFKIVRLDYLVLDEVDRMLDMGFTIQLRKICEYLPSQRQTLMFSATMEDKIRSMLRVYSENPCEIEISSSLNENQPKIEEHVIVASLAEKDQKLVEVVSNHQGKMIIFAATQIRTEKIARLLEESGHPVSYIHGGRTQRYRKIALTEFRTGKRRIMVATDVASRGIDVDDVEYVVNFDLPQTQDDYTHRIGRTGRRGRTGIALNFITPGARSGKFWEPRPSKKGGGGGRGGSQRQRGPSYSGGGGGGGFRGRQSSGGNGGGRSRRYD